MGARRPSSSRRKYPTTTGGSTSGRWTSASRRLFPGKSWRARGWATASAIGKLPATLHNATLMLSRSISHSSLVTRPRPSSPQIGHEPVLSEDHLRLGGLDELEILAGRCGL